MVASRGREMGRTMRKKMVNCPAPSIFPDSLIEEGLTDDDVEGRYDQRQDQCPNGIFQSQQVANNKVGGNQTAVKHHGNEYDPGEQALQLISGTAHGITHQGSEQNAQHGAHNRNEQGNSQRLKDHSSLFKQESITFHGEFLGNQRITKFLNRAFSRKGD